MTVTKSGLRFLALTAVFVFAAIGASAESLDVNLPGQPAPLAGTLTLPGGEGRVPAVLVIAGSGPTDRNGNQPGLMNDAYRKLADGLSACGVATLRTDKRGIALSAAAEPDESNLTIETYVQDSIQWLDWLRARPRIASVSLLGHSEGALIATLAAQHTPVAHLALLAGAGRRAADLLRAQLRGIDIAPVLRTRADQMIRLLEQGETDEEPPAGLANLFRPGVQPYLISWFRLDPVTELSRVAAPTLVIQGTTDLQASVADARALAGARKNIRLEIIDGMNHVLRTAPTDQMENFATYTDTSRPLALGLMAALCGFFKS